MFKGKGFTLVELMTAIAVTSLLVAIALPNYQSFLIDIRIDNQMNQLTRILHTARNSAINHQSNVTICPLSESGNCTENWSKELSVFIDLNNNKAFDESNIEKVITYRAKLPQTESLLYGKGRKSIIFSPSGNLSGLSNGTFRFCIKGYEEKVSGIVIARSGRIYRSDDMNGDGRQQNRSGKNLTCS